MLSSQSIPGTSEREWLAAPPFPVAIIVLSVRIVVGLAMADVSQTGSDSSTTSERHIGSDLRSSEFADTYERMGTTKNTKSSRDTVEGLAARLREARESQGMTVRVAASRCGLTHDKISSVENETIRAGVTGNTLIKLSRGLGVSVDWLLGLSPYERPWAEMKTPRGPRPKRAAAKID